MNKIILLILTTFLTSRPPASAQRWQQKINYSIDVTLTDSTHTLDGLIHIQYINHSPDTLTFIWIRCWPNAFKNDRTAFSEQLIRNGRTDFYFSAKARKGYLNRLDFRVSYPNRPGSPVSYADTPGFRVDGQLARMEDHPQYIDVIKVILPNALPPGDSTMLTTPFHVQLPDNFSNDGYHQGIYQITQWYPRPAVYDDSGWHPDPYLGQGDNYNEFGDFDVRITVPANFTVAATGNPTNLPPTGAPTNPTTTGNPQPAPPTSDPSQSIPPTSNQPHPPFSHPPTIPTKTLHFHQSNVPDFAWFASRRLHSTHDTLQLPSGRIIDLYEYYISPKSPIARHSIPFMKDALRFYSTLLGDYPFDICTVVETRSANDQPPHPDDPRASYPALIAIDSRDTLYNNLKMTIQKEIGDNWLSIAIGANGHRYPWMTAGISKFYSIRYWLRDYRRPIEFPVALDTFHRSAVNTRVVLKADQPISTSIEDFTPDNYQTIAEYKTAIWLNELRRSLGTAEFDSCMREYFRRQQFHHAGPADLKAAFTSTIHTNPGLTSSGDHPSSSSTTTQPNPSSTTTHPNPLPTTPHLNLDSAFALLDSTGPVPPSPYHRPIAPNIQFIPHPTHQNKLNISPALGFNNYDHLMIGALIHNFNLPPDNWQVIAAPLYSTVSHQLNGLAHFNYAWYPHTTFRMIEAGINTARFSTVNGTDSSGHAIFGGFYKIAPYFRVFFPRPSPGSTLETVLEAKTYLIGEKSFNNYVLKSTDSLYYPVAGKYDFRYLNQLTFAIRDNRVLYPYSINLQVQQAAPFYRVNLDIDYFFNYSTTGGLNVRLFGAKFGYLGTRDPAQDLTQFEPKLTAVRGADDYTYGNYFIGRNDFNGLSSQQIMMRDGDLKLRTDLFQGLQGRSDNWVAAVNLNSTLPSQLVPAWLPLRLFLDLGTYAQAWSDNSPTSHFLYVGGFELDLFHNVLRIYAPLIYSSDFSNQLKTVSGQNGFFQKISFSINAGAIPFRKIFGYTPF